MGKVKMGIALTVALCLLVLFAFLPGITAKIIDISQKNRAGSSDITPISLDLSPETGQLSIVEKMHLLKDGYSYPIGEDGAKSTASEALSWVENIFTEYIDVNDIWGFDVPHYQVTPILYIDEQEPEKHGVFWGIYIVNEGASAQNLTIIADDETGTILGVHYDTVEMEEIRQDRYGVILDALCQLYLQQLDVAAMEDVEINPAGDGQWEPGRSYAQRFIALRDEEGHEVIVEFTVQSNGSFYMTFTE